MDITSKDIKRISDIAMMQSGIYMKSDPAGDIKYLQVKDINPGSKPDYSRITTVVDRGIGDQYRLRKNDLLFAAKGASNYCFLYDGVVEKNGSFFVIHYYTYYIKRYTTRISLLFSQYPICS